ncbi:MAG: hypothetical protein WC365_07515 [Candidatus Babeliales bacterium]
MIPFDITEAKDTGFFDCGTTQSGKSTLAKHQAEKLMDNGINVYALDVSKVWTLDSPIDNIIEVPHDCATVDIPANQSAVIDLSHLGYVNRIKYVIQFCKAIYEWHMNKGFKRAPFEFVIFEEAHTYFFNGCFRSPKQFSPCIDLVTVGANFNLRFGAITQFPAMLDKALVKITQQRYFGWSTEMNDLNYIRAFVGREYVNPKNPDSVFNLRKGQFLYQLRNNIAKIQSRPYVKKKADTFELNGQQVQFAYIL